MNRPAAALIGAVLMVSTGVMTPVANMIVVESAREHLEISFWDYARFGIPITFLTTAAGIVVLLVVH